MIEEELHQEIHEEKCEDEPYIGKEKWKPVSNISIDEIYKNLPEAKRYHENFVKFWLKDR